MEILEKAVPFTTGSCRKLQTGSLGQLKASIMLIRLSPASPRFSGNFSFLTSWSLEQDVAGCCIEVVLYFRWSFVYF